MRPLQFRQTTWDWSRPYVAGVVNVTPDSFSDGGAYIGVDAALRRADELIRAGADLIDIGGESTRPGAEPVSAERELERVLPIVERLAGAPVPISVDTTKAEVARACLAVGAEVVNDVSGGHFDAGMVAVASRASAYICGHLRGSSVAEVHAREGEDPGFEEVATELAVTLAGFPEVLRGRTIVDPGLGFGKGAEQNLQLCKEAGRLAKRLECAVMVGASRKRFVAELSGHEAPVPVSVRDAATVGASLAAIASGAHIVRVHAVESMVPALRLFEAVRRGGRPS